MKKIISLILCMGMLMMFCTVKAEEKVEGLHEKLSALFLVNNFTDEEIAEMKKQRDEYIDNKLWPGTLKYYRSTVANAHKTDEELYDEYTDMLELDFESGLLANWIKKEYLYQYAMENKIKYLLPGQEFWYIPGLNHYSAKELFDMDGVYIENGKKYFGDDWYGVVIMNDEVIDFLENEKDIEKMLIMAEETTVDDVRIIPYSDVFCILYIRCGANEYGIKIDDTNDLSRELVEIEKFKLYPMEEILEQRDKKIKEHSPNYTTPIKPTYEAEATALQSEGLLHGNENGLDLLKPLTRIEAAAMLLRALGKSETAETDSQVFTDVPETHWGYGAASAASSLGLVKGVGNNMFAPDKQVTAAEFSTMVLRAANEPEFNWEQAVEIMIEKGILTEETAEPMKLFTRGDMAKIIYEARNSGMLN